MGTNFFIKQRKSDRSYNINLTNKTKRFFVECYINGYCIEMLLDTGASISALSYEDAVKIGRDPKDELVHAYETTVTLANGDHTEGYSVNINSISLARVIEKNNFECFVFKNKGHSILGMDFLQRYNFTINTKSSTLNIVDSSYEHIGKRSAAGLFCFDCGKTLCRKGLGGVHQSKSGWNDKCTFCGKYPEKETLESNAAGLELGFCKKMSKKTGVSSCSSFSWAIDPRRFKNDQDIAAICNEYHDDISIPDFNEIIDNCPIHYTHSIGMEFS